MTSRAPFPPPFPWAEAMQFGFGVLRLSPDAFWRMTPRELAHAIAAVRGPVSMPMDRGALDALMTQFPDSGELLHE
ncbi:rcc01693 family protein [Tardiphaga sp. 215_C5_N2_1]|uniref:rcc01693 family protein n=1 Tax=Tardiphaga sp. 215_C5_N2_1 TaxID=3240774 RepID=UPI003F8CB002